jgi:mannose-1-phosphate guanylyltransferase/mannose-1-phosphate guanylyltransferase/mannose-6-phosphate isomerase
MEKADKVAVVPVDMGWSDIGSWDALHDLLGKDAHNNAHVGEIVNVDGSGNLVFSDGPLVTVSGVSDLLVIATGDAVMILPRGSSQDVKKIVEQLKARQHPSL